MASASDPPSSRDSEMPVAIGETLAGKYKVEEIIGIGGMGVVVAARHIELDDKVALKFLKPDALASKEAVERFVREAKNAVRLRSEHVAKVKDVGKLDTGAPYMVMEFLEGADLSRVVQATGSITIEESVHFVLQACEAIAEAHSLGIIHRDLKPQNLFVTRAVDGRPLVKVLDFGISKTLDTQSGLSLTRTSSIMGSPLYMSPEQMRSSKNVDQRSDIWGLGVILYELLTGRVPFEAEAIPELCLKVVQDPAEPPRSIRAEISEGLSAIVLKCLEKDPNNRFSNVAELAAALEPYSELSRGASERVASTLHLPSRPPMVSVSSLSSSNPKIGTGGTAWGKTQAVGLRGKRMPLFAGGGALVVVAAVGIGFAMKSGSSAKAAAAQPSATQATSASAPAQASVAEPVKTAPEPESTGVASATSTAEAPKPTADHATAAPSSKPHARTTGTARPATTTPKVVVPAVTAPPKTFE